MEKTQAQERKAAFDRRAAIAKDLADLAMRDIDEALASYIPPTHSELYDLWRADRPDTGVIDL